MGIAGVFTVVFILGTIVTLVSKLRATDDMFNVSTELQRVGGAYLAVLGKLHVEQRYVKYMLSKGTLNTARFNAPGTHSLESNMCPDFSPGRQPFSTQEKM